MRLGAVLVAVVVLAVAPPVAAESPKFDLQAHAGGRGQATGESLRAFAKSLELWVSTIELDINVTKDHQPLVWHDSIIEPQQCSDTGPAFAGDASYPYVGKPVHDLTRAQIHTLDCGKPASQFPRAEVLRGNKIAALPEVFSLTDSYRADVRYNIETKVAADHPAISAQPQEFVDVVLAAVRAAGKVGRVEIQSFDWRTLPLVRQAEPSIPLVALWNEHTWVPGSPWLATVNPDVVGDPVIGAMMVGASILSPEYSLVDRALVDRAHSLGLSVIPWTVDDANDMRTQIAVGVDGIITNYPAVLRTVMAELGMALPPAYQR
ncbi:MAG: glycerophosphodiester phosphodiesterase family protein [Mycobacterium sp.]